ncbi:ABC transporter substrate-binding protein [Amycolatopsis thermoflava]
MGQAGATLGGVAGDVPRRDLRGAPVEPAGLEGVRGRNTTQAGPAAVPGGHARGAVSVRSGSSWPGRLVRVQDDQYVPDLATRWTASPDAEIWTFTLRDGLTFCDGLPPGRVSTG